MLIGPLLLGCGDGNGEGEAAPPWTALPPHRDEPQVALDVNRAFVYYPDGTSPSRA